MIKSKRAQILYLSLGCAIGLLGVAASLGLFDGELRWDFYSYFTNASNYFCVAVLIAELALVLRRSGDGYVKAIPVLKFVGLVSILLTLIVYNFVLAPFRDVSLTLSPRSILLHIVIPIIYILDWFLFYERRQTSRLYPVYALSLPLFYVIFVYVHAAALQFDTSILNYNGDGALIYPYFFLNVELLGLPILAVCLVLLLGVLLGFGFAFVGLDRLKKRETAEKHND